MNEIYIAEPAVITSFGIKLVKSVMFVMCSVCLLETTGQLHREFQNKDTQYMYTVIDVTGILG